MNLGLTLRSSLWVAARLIFALLPLDACGVGVDGTAASAEEPATVETVEGSDGLSRISLTAVAAERLEVQTTAVRAVGNGAEQRTVIPYSAVLYEPDGDTWTYTSPESLTFIRAPIVAETIDGERADLSQ